MSSTDDHAAYELAKFEKTAINALATLCRHIDTAEQGKTPATGYAPLPVIREDLKIRNWIDHGGMGPESFTSFLSTYLRYSVQLHNPRYMAHQVSVPDYPAALAELINGVTSNPMAIYEMGPAAAALEFELINWMLRKIGWPEQTLPGGQALQTPVPAGGVLTHGGSLANLTALLAARARIAPTAWEQGVPTDLAVLAPPSSHYSISRAVSILGLGSRAFYPLDVDEFGVIQPHRLHDALARLKSDGKRCMALVANSCATATGLHDPLRAIGTFCNTNNIWFHTDACHGATALLSQRSRHYLDGIELADSIVWDAHKMMQVPVLCAAVLLRDARDFEHAFQQEASYLSYNHQSDSYHALPRAVECTKSALSLKLFLNLAWRGEQALGHYVDDRYEMAATFHKQINNRPGFECLCAPQANILCFRYGTDNQLQQDIRDTLVRNQRFHLSSALVNNQRYLRIAVMNKLTNAKTITEMLTAIEQTADELRGATTGSDHQG